VHTIYLNRYRKNINFTEMVVIQDDDSGGEIYTVRLYRNSTIIQTESFFSGNANIPVLKLLSSVFTTKINDTIQIDIKSLNETAFDEVLIYLNGYYYV